MTITFEIKACSKCGETKKLTQFSKKKEAYDGRNSACIVCENTRVREAYYQGTPEQQAERRKAKVAANRIYLKNNPGKQKQYQQVRATKLRELFEQVNNFKQYTIHLEQRLASLEQRLETLEK